MVKKIALLLLLVGGLQCCYAQFTRAKLQATGLTCALCSKAIHQALGKLPFVQEVSAEIKESSFTITAREGESVDPAKLRIAVEEAGFFIGGLYLYPKQDTSFVVSDALFKTGNTYYFLFGALHKEDTDAYQVLHEKFLTQKAFLKLSRSAVGDRLRQQPSTVEGSTIYYLKSQ